MTRAQRIVLGILSRNCGFPGYCDLMLETGCASYKSVDWVLDALMRRGYINSECEITDAGLAALTKVQA